MPEPSSKDVKKAQDIHKNLTEPKNEPLRKSIRQYFKIGYGKELDSHNWATVELIIFNSDPHYEIVRKQKLERQLGEEIRQIVKIVVWGGQATRFGSWRRGQTDGGSDSAVIREQ